MCKLLGVALASFLVLLPPAAGQGRPGRPLRPANLPMNTEADEDDPHVADGGKTLYWTVTKNNKDDIFFATRSSPAGLWPRSGKPVEGYIATKADDRSVYATSGRFPHYLYYATKKDEKSKNFDLYVAVRQDLGRVWASPTPVMNVNTEADELHPWLTEDGKALYFSRKTKDGWRVFYTTRESATGPGGWGKPKDAGLPANFYHATLTPKADVMYVQGRVDEDRWALFVSRWQAGAWTRPAPLEGLNSIKAQRGDMSPCLTRDGKWLYFASDRPGGKGGLDLYSISTAELGQRR